MQHLDLRLAVVAVSSVSENMESEITLRGNPAAVRALLKVLSWNIAHPVKLHPNGDVVQLGTPRATPPEAP